MMTLVSERTKWPSEFVETCSYVNKPGKNIFGHKIDTKAGILDRMLLTGAKIEVLSNQLNIPIRKVQNHIEELKLRNIPIDINEDFVKIRI